eukprot:12082570-Heterocapsa_arctica.AAC.1
MAVPRTMFYGPSEWRWYARFRQLRQLPMGKEFILARKDSASADVLGRQPLTVGRRRARGQGSGSEMT